MSVGSISSNPLAAAAYGAAAPAQERKAPETAGTTSRSIADHVAAADEHEPVRSFNSKLGTLLDTYL